MLTFVPMSRKVGDAFKPQIVLRNARGQCIGGKTGGETFATPEAAKARAYRAALIALRSVPDHARVAN